MLQLLQDPSKRFFDQIITPATFICFTQADKTYVKDGITGEIKHSGTNAATVIQNAIDNASALGGGSVYIAQGNYGTISITLKDKVRLIVEKNAITIAVVIASDATCLLINWNTNTITYYENGSACGRHRRDKRRETD